MATNYVFSIKSVKYGTPTGSNTMPTSGDLTPLPYTVKGSITFEQTEGTFSEFYVDQLPDPIKVITSDKGKLATSIKIYDLNYETMAVLMGGTGDDTGYTPALGWVDINLAMQINTDSLHTFDFYNSQVSARILDGGGRDKMFSIEAKLTPQMSADLEGSWKLRPTTA